MKLSHRRNQEEPAEVSPEPAAPAVGKGRPTPKRRDAVAPRGPVRAPQTRKEALARQKQLARESRAARRTTGAPMTAQQRREALRAGDPALLPRRDQGASRKLARDYVDSHRLFSNYLLWLFPLMIVSYLIPYVQFAVILVFFVLVTEWYVVGRRVRAMALERYGKAEGGAMSLGFYAGSRAYLPRRWRLPAPQVDLGDPI